MKALWLLPVLVWVPGLVAVALVAGRSAEEAKRLNDELDRLKALRPRLLELQTAARALSVRTRRSAGASAPDPRGPAPT